MRIKPPPEPTPGKKKSKHSTRADRASAHAAARIEARHAERDYFGRPIRPIAEGYSSILGTSAPASSPSKLDRMGATRLDAWLVANGLVVSRDKAKAAIGAGEVWVDGSNKVKASTPVVESTKVELRRIEDSGEPLEG